MTLSNSFPTSSSRQSGQYEDDSPGGLSFFSIKANFAFLRRIGYIPSTIPLLNMSTRRRGLQRWETSKLYVESRLVQGPSSTSGAVCPLLYQYSEVAHPPPLRVAWPTVVGVGETSHQLFAPQSQIPLGSLQTPNAKCFQNFVLISNSNIPS